MLLPYEKILTGTALSGHFTPADEEGKILLQGLDLDRTQIVLDGAQVAGAGPAVHGNAGRRLAADFGEPRPAFPAAGQQAFPNAAGLLRLRAHKILPHHPD